MTYFLHLVTMACLFIPVILGYNLVFGRGKILQFGTEGLTLLSAYAIWLTMMHSHSFLLSFIVGTIFALLLGLLFAWLALRLEADAFGILSIAVHFTLLAIVLNWTDVTRGALGIPAIPRMPFVQSLPAFALLAATVAVAWFVFMLRVDRGRLGRSLEALAENRFHAESLGISRISVYVQAFLIASFGGVLSQFLYPQYVGLLHPNDYRFDAMVFMVMLIVAGRPGSVWGVTISTFLLVFLKEGLRFIPMPYGLIGPLRLVLFGLILIVAVYARRKELFPQPRTI